MRPWRCIGICVRKNGFVMPYSPRSDDEGQLDWLPTQATATMEQQETLAPLPLAN
jgi:hypothetical protein